MAICAVPRLQALIVVASLGFSRGAAAAGPVYDVTSSADLVDAQIDGVCETAVGNGVCTLRAAVMEANLGPNPGAEEVTIQLHADTYLLTIAVDFPDDHSNGDLDLVGKVRIVGLGYDLTLIDGNLVDRVFNVGATGDVTLESLRVQRGRPPLITNRASTGGGIKNAGNLTLIRCLLRINETLGGVGDGGGIYSSGGTLTIVDSMLRVHHPPQYAFGGAIFAGYTTTSISGSALYSNSAVYGGAIFQKGGSLTMWNSTVSDNGADASGGGIELMASTATFNNVTIAGNIAGSGSGGGVYLPESSLVLSNSILDNRKTSVSGPLDDFDCPLGGSVISNGFNIVRASGGCVTGSVTATDPFLSFVAPNGGLTVTRAPGSNSLAIDGGKPTGCLTPLGGPLTTDQRGVTRPIGAACDLGAFEVEPKGDANGDGAVDVQDVFYLINFLFAGGPVPLGRADVDGNPSITVADVFYLINYLFANGPPPV